MNGTGRQQAGEIKRHIIEACERAGLVVQAAKFYLRRECDDRIVQVAAVSTRGPYQKCVIDIRTAVANDSGWSGFLDVACLASTDFQGLAAACQPAFIMRGREYVPLHTLSAELRKTVEEREQVLAAFSLGVEGPYTFGRIRWERV